MLLHPFLLIAHLGPLALPSFLPFGLSTQNAHPHRNASLPPEKSNFGVAGLDDARRVASPTAVLLVCAPLQPGRPAPPHPLRAARRTLTIPNRCGGRTSTPCEKGGKRGKRGDGWPAGRDSRAAAVRLTPTGPAVSRHKPFIDQNQMTRIHPEKSRAQMRERLLHPRRATQVRCMSR